MICYIVMFCQKLFIFFIFCQQVIKFITPYLYNWLFMIKMFRTAGSIEINYIFYLTKFMIFLKNIMFS